MVFRDDLDAARDAVIRLREIELVEQFGIPRRSDPGHGMVGGSPVAREAEERMRCADEREGLERTIGDVGSVIDGCRLVWARMADAVELHWIGIDGRPMSWREVGEELGVSAATATRWASVVIDWVDAVGPARARAGRGIAER